MGCKQNKRTLKRRIRKVISLCIFCTVLIFGGIFLSLSTVISRQLVEAFSEHLSISYANYINSPVFLEQMGINSLEDFDPQSPAGRAWIENLRKSGKTIITPGAFSARHRWDSPVVEPLPANGLEEDDDILHIENHDASIQLFLPKNIIFTTITLNGRVVYTNEVKDIASKMDIPMKAMTEELIGYFANTGSKQKLLGSDEKEIGTVEVRMNSAIAILALYLIGGIILIAGLLSLIAANILNKLFTIPLTIPLSKLDEKIRAVSQEDFESCFSKQIVLKRPLKEVESLADSTNLIMHKMKEYNERLQEQKQQLEAQNEELEAQNEELSESRRQIDEQNRLLENQNNELEAQNEELIESKRQIEEAQTLLVQSENMASIGQLTAAITHEINTPLGAIHSNTQMYSMFIQMLESNPAFSNNEELASLLLQMKETNDISLMACDRVNEIIKSLKTFTRLDQAEFQEADLNEGMKSALVLTSNLWKRKITLHQEYGSIPRIRCYPGLLNQVFMNIVVNAVQAIEDKGEIFIHTYHDENNVYVSIRDSGSGIREEHLGRIFDYGFTTKGAGVGMGLGLSICQNIIRKHSGEILVSSEPGKGTEFIVRLPVNAGS